MQTTDRSSFKAMTKFILFYLMIGCIINLFLARHKALHHWLIPIYILLLWPILLGWTIGSLVKRGRKN